jgi:predicted Ser/Thr protein kinase
MNCPACRGEVSAGARFCQACGSPVVSSAAEAKDPLRAALEDSLGFQYRVERLLGRGGMGAVYLARELALDRDVAIKVLPPDRVEAADAVERFRREARTAARLSHPNIVPLYTFGEVKGLVYFVMGYVRGESLAAHLGRRGRLAVEEARRILVEVAEALAYAHAQGVVHRDIKPDNILIEAVSGRALLTDFGVAKARSLEGTLTATGLVVGTPRYMSPEQAAGRPDIDGRSDLYSLGVVGYAMLSGRLPFEGDTPGDVLVQHMTKEPPPLHTATPGVPYAVTAPVMRCLAKDPSKRFQDAKALQEALAPREAHPELPARVRALNAIVQALLLLAVIRGYVWLALASNPDPLSFAAFLREPAETSTYLGAVACAFTAIQTRRRLKLGWGEILRSAFLQPGWWPGWYPRALRRPGDLWDRLPPQIRAARHLIAAALVSCAAGIVPAAIVLASSGTYYERKGIKTSLGIFVDDRNRLVPGLGVLVLVAILGNVLAALWLRRRLGEDYDSGYDFDVMPLLGATWARDSAWRKPAYAALLRPADSGGPAAPRSEAELLKSIEVLVGALPAGLGELALVVRAATCSLRDAMAALEEERAGLARDSDPEEAARLEGKLTALGVPSSADPPGRQEMRGLLTQQVALIRELQTRYDAAGQKRAQLAERVRLIWQALSGLTSGVGAPPDPRKVELLRAICAEIATTAQDGIPTLDGALGEIHERPTLQR